MIKKLERGTQNEYFRPGVLVFAMICIAMILEGQAKAEPVNPGVFIEKVANDTFAAIRQLRKENNADPKAFEEIIQQTLLPHVDHVYSGLLILGSSANSSAKQDIQAYLDVFKGYIKITYASSLNYYQDQTVVFEPVKHEKDKDKVAVNAIVKDKGKPDIQMQFKLRLDKSGDWKAYDLIVEGVSLVQSKRAEFAPIIRQQGLPGLTALLAKKLQ
ncbi:MlaC/ttg2D family ABC transporter substrate-binding protein [Planctobacterium marinum]|uniref:Signal peptidase n=1 Tax=Planctobacterium marinum TaxID=1631968 RepID=A0AA48HKU3_9ALTE|nr:signal peptidase [Planctobacterium marinum]